MQKIFTTQLIGLMNLDEFMLEDAARLLSQALVGDGSIYVYGKEEMASVTSEALYGKEKFENVKPLFVDGEMVDPDSADRVLLLARSAADRDVESIAKSLSQHGISIVGITAITEEARNWTDLVDVHIDLQIKNSLVPTDTGERIGFPASLMALYTYFCIHLIISEIVSEYQ